MPATRRPGRCRSAAFPLDGMALVPPGLARDWPQSPNARRAALRNTGEGHAPGASRLGSGRRRTWRPTLFLARRPKPPGIRGCCVYTPIGRCCQDRPPTRARRRCEEVLTPSRSGLEKNAGRPKKDKRSAVALQHAIDHLALPLARAAAAFHARRGWRHYGCASAADTGAECFQRSGRWLSDMASLGRSVARFPALGRAVAGDDGRAAGAAGKGGAVAPAGAGGVRGGVSGVRVGAAGGAGAGAGGRRGGAGGGLGAGGDVDELQAAARRGGDSERFPSPPGRVPGLPPDDGEWQASLRREPGRTRARVWELGEAALREGVADDVLRLWLTAEEEAALRGGDGSGAAVAAASGEGVGLGAGGGGRGGAGIGGAAAVAAGGGNVFQAPSGGALLGGAAQAPGRPPHGTTRRGCRGVRRTGSTAATGGGAWLRAARRGGV
jgi:hypothetical protein